MKMAKKDILLEEELEISSRTGTGAPIRLPIKFLNIFPALAHRNLQLYVTGQAISLVGFWLHQVAMGWLVFRLTNSAFWVATTAAIGGLPFLIFTPFAGVLIDKVNRQRLLVITQLVEATAAFLLGTLVLTDNITLQMVLALVFINGIAGAIDLPARLTFIVQMVGKRDLASAIPINIGLFNTARFIGPAIAGILIAAYGEGWLFIANGLSFIAGIWAILAIRPVFVLAPEVELHPWSSFKFGLSYSFKHPKIFYFMILGLASAIFIWPYQTLMPPIAQDVFASGSVGLGSLLSAAGAGSLLGAIFTSAHAKNKSKAKFVILGLFISSIAFIIFSLNRSFLLAHALLLIAGFGLVVQASTQNTLVQLLSPDNMRGRIMAIYLTMFVGMMPVGNLLAGAIAQRTSVMFTIGLGSAAMLFVGLLLFQKGVFKNLSS